MIKCDTCGEEYEAVHFDDYHDPRDCIRVLRKRIDEIYEQLCKPRIWVEK